MKDPEQYLGHPCSILSDVVYIDIDTSTSPVLHEQAEEEQEEQQQEQQEQQEVVDATSRNYELERTSRNYELELLRTRIIQHGMKNCAIGAIQLCGLIVSAACFYFLLRLMI